MKGTNGANAAGRSEIIWCDTGGVCSPRKNSPPSLGPDTLVQESPEGTPENCAGASEEPFNYNQRNGLVCIIRCLPSMVHGVCESDR